MNMLIAVAVGGAVGAVARYKINGLMAGWLGTGFPWGTLTVNLLGCFLMGVLVETFALKLEVSPELRALLITGFLGALTTFSAFSLDVAVLSGREAYGPAFLYVGVSVIGSLAAIFLAMRLTRLVLA
ncbi:MAG: fluoride efflux transporter CrcB [Alphaproteobacteria bacterium]|nr:fluoride efflux transporter CrcB [Alphaproteobacteria bacterium]MBU0798825.1 fluoride efflux transporter CrcB [Alphaproteobacteria bacterium]MBU0888180.1 fluoride efflux transporter CrcB [Alphaproteobacteria bacterium]MBU1811625.1 fluoride efflux transporter CrcB [Alphaproteobacteria bacterium]MBU2088962.1 fluoride efflux transporter CrcB [Alphaproteobacteria bacterium]